MNEVAFDSLQIAASIRADLESKLSAASPLVCLHPSFLQSNWAAGLTVKSKIARLTLAPPAERVASSPNWGAMTS